ncbi:MAG: hypothetical protein QOD58_818, partial [Mycobacterium sp.]|nr:hypothetical protein [Mycobacterium sp.]
MSIKVALEHRTSYTFDKLVQVYPHVVRLRPAPHSRTTIEAYSLRIEPGEHFINWQQDALGNFLARLVFPKPTKQLTITVGLIADLKVINPFDFFIEDWAETWSASSGHTGWSYPKSLADDLKPFMRPVDENGEDSGPGDLVQAWVQNFSVPGGTRTIDFLVALNRAINVDVTYSLRMEPGVQTPDFTLRTGVGSCRDSAWLLVSILRQLGLAARFVSGYLVQLASDVVALDGPSGPVADFTDLHAWTEVYIPGAGWIGLDPTSGLFAGEGHIPLAATPHPMSAAPITGSTDPCTSVLEFSNSVTRVHEDPRVTLPYTDEAWQTIRAVGQSVDERLTAGDVRLTVGGEPTFVSVDNQVDPEWRTAADGPHKRVLASELAARLKTQWAPQGLVQRNQGKWYPGEPLPRWQIGLHWRTDGRPLWNNEALLADPWLPEADQPPPVENDTAHEVLAGVAEGLGLPLSQVRPAFEDPLTRLAAAVRLPSGDAVDPADDLAPETGKDTAADRAALVARLDDTVSSPTAFVLPVHRREDGSGWASANWRLRRGRLVLTEGDSPAGLRLPLNSISWSPPPASYEVDPVTIGHELPAEPVVAGDVAVLVDPENAPTTALVAQVRDGLLYIFLPPTVALEDFIDLIARIEAAAAKVDCPLVIEGYGPPPDPRLTSMTVTPDPGVIEVNVAPTASFDEQRLQLETLYEQARLTRLSTESFDIDGTHGGTGGGNHITLGGVTPADSPMLRRADLLVSLLTYWQRHPALSYLFAGRFIGTTSQAPRVDEGRSEALYELEIAFAEITRLSAGGGAKPWVTDRALRHLLTDITGNTHRAEFCIDKLYSPEGARGRLGLLELRGFEMPPHVRMAMVQSLLVRSLVAWFWEEPLRAPLIRHGANLHGRYLLPHFLIQDIADVAADLRAHGIAFETSWLDPFTEFRFPRIGTALFDGVEIELRGAIEPWNTLGEESTGTGTARYVDSSVERVQVRIIGADRHRYAVTCNGYPVPLLATDNPDIHVGGVRFRAWQPPSALHPTISTDVPLQFELIDLTTGTSRGGCTYHVAHPGGRSYDEPPVNAVEAESRRARRFE